VARAEHAEAIVQARNAEVAGAAAGALITRTAGGFTL